MANICTKRHETQDKRQGECLGVSIGGTQGIRHNQTFTNRIVFPPSFYKVQAILAQIEKERDERNGTPDSPGKG